MTRTVDYSALLGPVTAQSVKEFRLETKAAGKKWGAPRSVQAVTIAAVVLVVLALTPVLIGPIMRSVSSGAGWSQSIPWIIAALLVGGVIFVVGSAVSRRNWTTWMRLDSFARSNGMAFSPRDAAPQYPGAIFTVGDSRVSLNHLTSTSGRFLDIGNYQYATGSGKSRSTHNWGFMALRLDRKLPNMVLDSKANNGLFGGTNLPTSLDKKQILSLEGDFNEYFRLYCPQQYERDALYIFTPDLMALLIDNASPFDVEIIDDWMFFYSSRPFQPARPETYQRLFTIVDTVGTKTLSQSHRYVDENVGNFAANYVAPQGQRLKRGGALGAAIVGGILILFWVLPRFFDLFSLFSR